MGRGDQQIAKQLVDGPQAGAGLLQLLEGDPLVGGLAVLRRYLDGDIAALGAGADVDTGALARVEGAIVDLALEVLDPQVVLRQAMGHLGAHYRLLTGRNALLKQKQADFEALTDIALAGRAKGLGSWSQFESDATDEALRSNIRVFLAGAMEATTSFASWALSHLSRRPDLQEQIHAEVKDMNVYDPDNLAQAVTLNRVLEETLRLTPALYFLPRRASVDTWIETADHRKMFMPKGTHLRLDVWHANRCEEFWGQAVTGYPAETFEPKRWEFLAAKGITAKDMLHFGFGHGPRFCPGRFLGMLEVGLVVGAVVKIFKFTAAGETTKAKAGVSSKPADGVLVDLELRT